MIDSANLTVLSVMENDSGLGHLMVESIKKFTYPLPKIIIANRGRNGKLMKYFTSDPSIKIVDNMDNSKSLNSSARHGLGINAIFGLVKTEYVAVVESDCVVLRKDWFDFDTSKYEMMAAKKKDEFGEEQYHICFLVFKTNLLEGMDWKPIKSIVGGPPWRDTGFRIFSHIGGKTSIIKYLDLKTCASKKTKVFRRYFEHKSFELYKDNGMPIAAHFGRGSDLSRRPPNGLGLPKHQKRRWAGVYYNFVKSLEK